MENGINEEFEEIEETTENYYEDSSENENEIFISEDSSNTLIENQTLILEKLDNFTTCLNAIFFLICLWFVMDLMRRMINTK